VKFVTDNIARCMSLEDRQEHGVKTLAELSARGIRKSEKKEHSTFVNWCLLNDIPCRRDRMDKRITGNVGWPDFTLVYGNRVLLLEFKVGGNKLSDDQKQVHAHFERTGTDVMVCYSADEAIRKAKGWLWEHWHWEPLN
jgi:hypothetical protein